MQKWQGTTLCNHIQIFRSALDDTGEELFHMRTLTLLQKLIPASPLQVTPKKVFFWSSICSLKGQGVRAQRLLYPTAAIANMVSVTIDAAARGCSGSEENRKCSPSYPAFGKTTLASLTQQAF